MAIVPCMKRSVACGFWYALPHFKALLENRKTQEKCVKYATNQNSFIWSHMGLVHTILYVTLSV